MSEGRLSLLTITMSGDVLLRCSIEDRRVFTSVFAFETHIKVLDFSLELAYLEIIYS